MEDPRAPEDAPGMNQRRVRGDIEETAVLVGRAPWVSVDETLQAAVGEMPQVTLQPITSVVG